MAPAIVHFLVGASLVLLAATPFALRYRAVRRWGPGLVLIGGLWGLFPDLYKVAPIYRDELRTLHGPPWAELFAFHHALDRPVVRELSHESIAASILVFVAAVTAYTLASRAGERDSGTGITRVVAATTALFVAAALATGVFGGVLALTDRMDGVAALYGREHPLAGWALVFALSLAAGTVFAAVLPVAGRYASDPRVGGLLGLGFGLAAWALAVAVALPVWTTVVLGVGLPIPYLEWTSLLALGVAGSLFGSCYPIVKGGVTPRERS